MVQVVYDLTEFLMHHPEQRHSAVVMPFTPRAFKKAPFEGLWTSQNHDF